MFEMIEVKENVRDEAADVLGWRVSVSQRVWDRCVKLPKGAKGQTEGGRLHDLLAHLRFNLKEMAAPRQNRISAGFGFPVNVMNDDRERRKFPDGLVCPGEEVLLEVFGSFDRDGTPLLVVLAQSEVPRRRTGPYED